MIHFLNCSLAGLVVYLGAVGYAGRIENQSLPADRERVARCCEPLPNPLPECKCTNCRCGDKVAVLDSFIFLGKKFFVNEKTVTIFDGKPTPWFDIPDFNTEPVEVGFDLETNIVTRIVYRTKREL